MARDEGVPYNTQNYAGLLRTCNRDAQWAQALRVVRQMAREGVSYDQSCAQSVLAVCVRGLRWENALQAYNLFMQKKGIMPDDMCGVSLFRALRIKFEKASDRDRQVKELCSAVLSIAKRHPLLLQVPHSAQEAVLLLKAIPASDAQESKKRHCP